MKTGLYPHLRRSLSIAAAGILALALTACTGRGGGQLPPVAGFTGSATFGFDVSCEDTGGLNPRPGQLRIQLAYTERGSNPAFDSSFSIHGIADTIDPVVESMICSGPNPPLVPNELTFLGRYRLTSSAPASFPSACTSRESETTRWCRFEVFVRDNDMDRAPSNGDYFQIRLSNGIALDDELDPAAVFYIRAGFLSSGNLTVD